MRCVYKNIATTVLLNISHRQNNQPSYTYPDVRRHFIGADFGKVTTDNAKIKSIEKKQETKVHGDLGLDEEQDIETKQRQHDGEVTYEADRVAHLVQHQEPLVHKSVDRTGQQSTSVCLREQQLTANKQVCS